MTDSTQTQTIEVAFYGATLVVTEHNHQPYVPMKPVVTGMGLDWKSQFAKLTTNKGRWGMVEIAIPSAGGQQGMSCLPLRKLPGWLATISPNKVRPELREKVIAFQNEADDVLWQAWQEKQPQAPTQRPYNPAIDYTRISPAQAQDIKELVHQVVDSGVQTFGETWNRLHNKFRVNSYLELPATKYDEVCAYLRGKLPNGYADSVVFDSGAPTPPVLDLQRIHAAMQTATQASAQVQQAVFESVLAGNDEWKFGRWLLSFITDSKLASPAVIQRVGHDEFVTSTRQLIDCINDPGFLLSNTELAGLAQACTNRLARRLGGGAGSMLA
ncbi:phage antirepressor N-terminal domain-containing protein [Giesbergeria anulus]|uniref:phage antirepressor N-terminal domain-containing protein n=1 Tax=Giesbergeria anulus TaxID=180197 RepID=UPI001C434F61|nr:phage antirepressor N-terminal domain-containing protein [Giesbergeria anulus]